MTKSKKEPFIKSLKFKILIIASIFAVIIIYSAATLIYRAGKYKVSVQIAPNDAVITINNTRVGNKSDCWLEPGKYHLVAKSSEHLATYERDFEVKDEPVKIYATLGALDDEGRDFIEKHRQEYANVEGLIGDLMNKEGEKEREKNPILNHLPINTSLYSISYEYDDNQNLTINVKTDPQYIDTVVAKLKTFKDINISNLNIVFRNKNIFENYKENNNSDLKQFIRTAYNLPANYTINDPQQLNDYYYTTVYINDYKNSLQYAHYRILLKQEEGNWKIISTPQPILTTYNTPNTDINILNTINSYQPSYLKEYLYS